MSILIIGGAGFIGSHLAEYYVRCNKEVVSLDNYFTGSEGNHVDGVRYLSGTSAEINDIDFGTTFDLIFHLGEYSRVEQSFEDESTVFDLNHAPIYEVLRFWRNSNAKLIYSGSSTKFGEYADGDMVSPYALIKRHNADLVKNFANWHSLNYAITYFYNVYGGREISDGKYSTVIAKYVKLVLSGVTELPVHSPGTQERNFTHVDDIVTGLAIVAERGRGDGYGIGADDAFSVLDLVELLGANPLMHPARLGNRSTAALNTQQTKDLGWNCSWSLQNYLQRALSGGA